MPNAYNFVPRCGGFWVQWIRAGHIVAWLHCSSLKRVGYGPKDETHQRPDSTLWVSAIFRAEREARCTCHSSQRGNAAQSVSTSAKFFGSNFSDGTFPTCTVTTPCLRISFRSSHSLIDRSAWLHVFRPSLFIPSIQTPRAQKIGSNSSSSNRFRNKSSFVYSATLYTAAFRAGTA